ncbi:MAG: hypothetical protein H0W89_00735 [Candidatus Levybacteria bacterium]|nr:hypothetical protein [Candidatus Levybacteria bacterium]
MSRFERGLSIGHTTLNSHENDNATPVVTLNYVGPDHRLPLPYPEGDWYLRGTAVPAARPGEIVITNTLIPGLLDYYRKVGLVTEGTDIMEVEPGRDYGFPHTDPLETLGGQVELQNGVSPLSLVSTFSSNLVDEQERILGLQSLARPDSALTNDKARFREAASNYGVRMLPGTVLSDWGQFAEVEDEYAGAAHGVWLKAPTGSGGDLVHHIPTVTRKNLLAGQRSIRDIVATSFEAGEFDVSATEYWSPDKVAPQGSQLVIESDARNFGKIKTNGSTQFVTTRSGRTDIIGHFEQITTEEGEYLGNRPYRPVFEEQQEIVDQVKRVGNMSRDEGYYGIQGVDWFVVETPSGDEVVYITERNTRPTANTPPVIIGEKVGAKEWINTNAYTDRPIDTIEDYIEVVGEDLAFGDPQIDGLVVPQAFRTLVSRQETRPSPDFKILILGNNAAHCDTIAEKLRGRGIRFSPDAE